MWVNRYSPVVTLNNRQARASLEQLQSDLNTIVAKDPIAQTDGPTLTVIEALVSAVADAYPDHVVVRAIAESKLDQATAKDALVIVVQLHGAIPIPGPVDHVSNPA